MALRRLIDLPGMADLEFKAVMRRDYAEPEARADNPELDETSLKLFGITADQAEATDLPDGLRAIDTAPPQKQAELFEASGWDITDDKRKPMRTLAHWNQQLWLAIHGVAGTVPFAAEPADKGEDDWTSALAKDAARFKKR
jgi:hypothetical protein